MSSDLRERRFLIKKGGAYYRPNSQGYTLSAILAGRYSLQEATSITHPNGPDGPRDGMSFIHEDKVIDEDWVAYSNLLRSHKEAVAKAVAEEREACASKVANFRAHLNQEALLKLFTDQPLNTKLVENVSKFLDGISAAIRARSEQKGGE